MDRRDFIRITAATGATATLASCGNPENQVIRFIPDESIFPGVATSKPSICPLCSAGCGVNVRVMDGDAEVLREGKHGIVRMSLAKKLEGNPVHPVSQGKLCARGQAAIQVTYHPDRIRQPLRKKGKGSTAPFESISWEEALTEFTTRLNQLRVSGKKDALGFLSRPLSGHRDFLAAQFARAFGERLPLTFEVFDDDVLREANARSFGFRQLPTFDLARSRYVLSFGADFLGTWNSPVSHSVAYGAMRQDRPGTRAKFVQVEPRMSQTGANADEWIPAKPGTEGILALGLAHVILADKLRTPSDARRTGHLFEGWERGLPVHTPEAVERATGVPASRIRRIARELAGQTPSVAMIGGAPLAHTHGTFQALAVNALNELVGAVHQEGGMLFSPSWNKSRDQRGRGVRINELASEIIHSGGSAIDMMLIYDVNPVFGTPPAWRVAEALKKVPYIVSFGSFMDETSILADLILPDHSFLESWVDHVPESGTPQATASVAPPVMRPIHQTRSMTDVLLEAARRLEPPLQPLAQWKNQEEMLRSNFLQLTGTKPEDWDTAQKQGGWWAERTSSADSASVQPKAAAAAEPKFAGDPGAYPFHLLPFVSQAFLDGSTAHLPWLQELPDVVSTAMWSSWVEINPRTAESLKIVQGDMVDVVSEQGAIRLPALISPGIAPDVVAVPAGQGHQTFTRYASGRGANPVAVLAPLVDSETGALAWAATRVRITKAAGAGDLILFSGGMKEHEDAEHR